MPAGLSRLAAGLAVAAPRTPHLAICCTNRGIPAVSGGALPRRPGRPAATVGRHRGSPTAGTGYLVAPGHRRDRGICLRALAGWRRFLSTPRGPPPIGREAGTSIAPNGPDALHASRPGSTTQETWDQTCDQLWGPGRPVASRCPPTGHARCHVPRATCHVPRATWWDARADDRISATAKELGRAPDARDNRAGARRAERPYRRSTRALPTAPRMGVVEPPGAGTSVAECARGASGYYLRPKGGG